MSGPNDPQTWADYAEDDWKVARNVLRYKRPATALSCFHAQQCAEKYLKALLLTKGLFPPKTHDLNYLNDLCEQSGMLSGFSERDLTFLSIHAVAVRYPGEAPTLEEARQALAIARAVRKFARTFLGLE